MKKWGFFFKKVMRACFVLVFVMSGVGSLCGMSAVIAKAKTVLRQPTSNVNRETIRAYWTDVQRRLAGSPETPEVAALRVQIIEKYPGIIAVAPAGAAAAGLPVYVPGAPLGGPALAAQAAAAAAADVAARAAAALELQRQQEIQRAAAAAVVAAEAARLAAEQAEQARRDREAAARAVAQAERDRQARAAEQEARDREAEQARLVQEQARRADAQAPIQPRDLTAEQRRARAAAAAEARAAGGAARVAGAAADRPPVAAAAAVAAEEEKVDLTGSQIQNLSYYFPVLNDTFFKAVPLRVKIKIRAVACLLGSVNMTRLIRSMPPIEATDPEGIADDIITFVWDNLFPLQRETILGTGYTHEQWRKDPLKILSAAFAQKGAHAPAAPIEPAAAAAAPAPVAAKAANCSICTEETFVVGPQKNAFELTCGGEQARHVLCYGCFRDSYLRGAPILICPLCREKIARSAVDIFNEMSNPAWVAWIGEAQTALARVEVEEAPLRVERLAALGRMRQDVIPEEDRHRYREAELAHAPVFTQVQILRVRVIPMLQALQRGNGAEARQALLARLPELQLVLDENAGGAAGAAAAGGGVAAAAAAGGGARDRAALVAQLVDNPDLQQAVRESPLEDADLWHAFEQGGADILAGMLGVGGGAAGGAEEEDAQLAEAIQRSLQEQWGGGAAGAAGEEEF